MGAKGKVATGIVHLQEGERRWKTSALLKTGSQPASPAAQHCCSLTHSPAALPEQRVDCVDLSRQRQRQKQRQRQRQKQRQRQSSLHHYCPGIGREQTCKFVKLQRCSRQHCICKYDTGPMRNTSGHQSSSLAHSPQQRSDCDDLSSCISMTLNTKYVPCAVIFIMKCFARFNNALSQ